MPLLGEAPLPLGCSRAATSATVRRTRSASSRPATPPTCGRSAQRGQRAAAEVEAVELHLARGVGERERGDQRAQQRATCRSAAPPTTATWPAAPGQVQPAAGRGAARTACRRCRPAPAARRAAPAVGGGQPARRVGGERRRAARRGSAARSSGGSHTWWAGGPCAARAGRTSDVEQAVSAVSSASGSASAPARASATGARRHVVGAERRRPGAAGAAAPRRAAALGRYGPGDVGGLEPGQRGRCRTSGSRARARGAARRRRARRAPPGDSMRGERPQADPVRQVRVQPAQPALLQPLRGEQQVHAERPAEPADLHEQVDEVAAWPTSSSENSSQTISSVGSGAQRARRRARACS